MASPGRELGLQGDGYAMITEQTDASVSRALSAERTDVSLEDAPMSARGLLMSNDADHSPGRVLQKQEIQETVDIWGTDFLRDEGDWNLVVVFPFVEDAQDAEWQKMLEKSEVLDRARAYFCSQIWDNEGNEFDYLDLEATFQTKMCVLDFHGRVRRVIGKLLAGPHMGMRLETSASIDRDELFLKIQLVPGETCCDWAACSHMTMEKVRNSIVKMPMQQQQLLAATEDIPEYNTIEQLADALEMRMPLLPKGDAYTEKMPCPTSIARLEDGEQRFSGTRFMPAYTMYERERRDIFQPISRLNQLRICQKWISEFVDLSALREGGVTVQGGFFNVHSWDEVGKFRAPKSERPAGAEHYPHGWGCIENVLQWPGEQHIDHVRDYFGEEVAFFFHWLNFFTLMLIPLALVGALLTVGRFMGSARSIYVHVIFTCVMIAWSSSFCDLYMHRAQIKVAQWGMANWHKVDSIATGFRKEMRGSNTEAVRRTLHWLLVCVFLAWTVSFTYYVSTLQSEMLHKYPEEKFLFGLSGEKCGRFLTYAITLNIKVIDTVWYSLSPYLSQKENYRSKSELKEAIQLKLIVVKVFVYYYPFWYTAFLKEHIEGCPPVEGGCMHELETNLLVFILFHIAWVIFATYLPTIQIYREVKKEMAAASSSYGAVAQHSYLQFQAKCSDHPGDTDDFLELIISMGLVMQFSVVLPVVATLIFLSNMLEIRLLAYQMLLVYRRPSCEGREGIGQWLDIIRGMGWIALVVNVALVTFSMPVLHRYSPTTRIVAFVVTEHVLMALKILIEAAIPDTLLISHLIQERNDDVLAKLSRQEHSKSVRVSGPKLIPNMPLSFEGHRVTWRGRRSESNIDM